MRFRKKFGGGWAIATIHSASIAALVATWWGLAVLGFAQDVADRVELMSMLTNDEDEEFARVRSAISPHIDHLADYAVLAVVYTSAGDARMLYIVEKHELTDDDPFADAELRFLGFELAYWKSGNRELITREIQEDNARSLVNSAWELIKEPALGVQEKNLLNVPLLSPYYTCYVFCSRAPIGGRSMLYGGVIYNPQKETKSEAFLRRILVLVNMFEAQEAQGTKPDREIEDENGDCS